MIICIWSLPTLYMMSWVVPTLETMFSAYVLWCIVAVPGQWGELCEYGISYVGVVLTMEFGMVWSVFIQQF
jgi:hypothetical protein